MRSYILFSILAIGIGTSGCRNQTNSQNADSIIAPGQMPNIAKDNSDKIHLVYGVGDSIMYSYSADHGKTFANPALISILPELAASHMRGPQVAAISGGLVVTACTNSGNIFTYIMDRSGKWTQTSRVNDVDTVAKENLMALTADGENVFCCLA